MYGIIIDGSRPKSKKQVKETSADEIYLQGTSLFGDEKSGYLTDMPDGTYTFVGPDPYNNRRFYGNIHKSGDKVKIS